MGIAVLKFIAGYSRILWATATVFSFIISPRLGLMVLWIWFWIELTTDYMTIYLHRYRTHRALALHGFVRHLFRLINWLKIGIKELMWVKVHRKHHANSDEEEDPHSPHQRGLWAVLFGQVFLYRRAARDPSLDRFIQDIKVDWLEKYFYQPLSWLGTTLMLLFEIYLFSIPGRGIILFVLPGLTVWVVQFLWIGVATGLINGLGHAARNINPVTKDYSQNVVRIDNCFGGELLHGNHHVAQWSAKFSFRDEEIDGGWLIIKILERLGLAYNIKIYRPSESSPQR